MKIREVPEAVIEMMESLRAVRQEGPREKACLAEILEKKCTGCGLCVKMCPAFVLEMRHGNAQVVSGERCTSCGHCVAVCPADAVKGRFASRRETPAYDPAQLPSAKSLQLFFRSRRSVRVYRDKPVSRKDLERILDAGRYAPTAGNRQDVHYIVFTRKEEIAELREILFPVVYRMFELFKHKIVGPAISAMMGPRQAEELQEYLPFLDLFQERWQRYGDDRMLFNAPAIMLVHGSRWDDTVGVSCAIVLYQASLMAEALNVGCCYNGFLQVAANTDRKIRRWLGIPWGHKCFGAVTLGYQKVPYRRFVHREPPKVTWR